MLSIYPAYPSVNIDARHTVIWHSKSRLSAAFEVFHARYLNTHTQKSR